MLQLQRGQKAAVGRQPKPPGDWG